MLAFNEGRLQGAASSSCTQSTNHAAGKSLVSLSKDADELDADSARRRRLTPSSLFLYPSSHDFGATNMNSLMN